MSDRVQRIVIVGGGSAGWLTAALLAAKHGAPSASPIQICLVESSDIPTVGVGEGTWPTMKNTLQQIGIAEKEFFTRCHATFKQGGKFVNWNRTENDFYYHPFNVPLGYGRIDLAPYLDNVRDYAAESNFQHHVCEAGLGPRSLSDDEFQGQCNYAYHLDAGAFADMLREHCVQKLGVDAIIGTVQRVDQDEAGYLSAIALEDGREIPGDLFVDCTGFASLLLGQTLGVKFKPLKHILFNNRALAMQVPYTDPQHPIATHTIATGQPSGWTWDIGLTNRRGVGYVYSTDFATEEEAEQTLHDYIGPQAKDLNLKRINFESGHRECWWKKNCVAVGLSAGFVEPLEATALMLIELSGRFLADNLPPDRAVMQVMEKRFNQKMAYRWQRIVDFLKLHYMLTERPEPYWQANRENASIPDSLRDDLLVWSTRGPITEDFDSAIELFPAASYQYVLYGMGFKPDFTTQAYLYDKDRQAYQILARNRQLADQMLKTLPGHRDLIESWLAA
ncbi:tryptophan halogenase family protein [Marinimicrobium sp. C2-29]|uniref:tryptophan halogenase family protein n=1 Tax=Marinimicrobium sp. C2-29 TaxID=3139825 RepID=UPI0031386897